MIYTLRSISLFAGDQYSPRCSIIIDDGADDVSKEQRKREAFSIVLIDDLPSIIDASFHNKHDMRNSFRG
ncbi:hypothetical protein AFK24_15730 [Pseudomonas syringae]|uniref:Uncharacterized protein n=1 Tax=Pseudomonas syringae TaxID=317 RepID=A0A1C7Z584_PSESX|nr:hypothetical protein AFK24_15730 [Pseudomonas syringae]